MMNSSYTQRFQSLAQGDDGDSQYEKEQLLREQLNSPSSSTLKETDDTDDSAVLNTQYVLQEYHRLLQRQTMLQWVLGGCILLLLALVSVQLGMVVIPGLRISSNPGESCDTKHVAVANEKLPKVIEASEFPPHLVEFNPDDRYIGTPSEVQKSWDRLWPIGRGFVRAHGRDQDSSDDSYYGVSAFHQIHCLWMFHKTLYLGVNNQTITEKHLGHSTHCIEYLRQSIVCNADPSLEFTYDMKVPGQESARATWGWNVTHVCRDYKQLLEWADVHADQRVL